MALKESIRYYAVLVKCVTRDDDDEIQEVYRVQVHSLSVRTVASVRPAIVAVYTAWRVDTWSTARSYLVTLCSARGSRRIKTPR